MSSAMRSVAMRNLAAHKVRLALTLISVLLGTAFVAGSFIFTDTLKTSFNTIFDTADKGIDARVQAAHGYQAGVPINLVPTIAHVPGVRTVETVVHSPLVLVDDTGKRVDTNGAPSVGSAWQAHNTIGPATTLAQGRAPTRAGQIAINDGAASKYHLTLGEHVRLVLPNAPITDATIVGIYNVSYDTGGYLGALLSRDQAMSLFSDGSHYTAVNVAASSGVSEQQIVDRLTQAVPAGLQVKTGTQVRDDDAGGITTALSFITYILLGFGIVALLVGTFIIYNTFSMIVAQRQRELALLRAIGADRRQVRRSVTLEALLIGLAGSALGLAGGIGLAYGLHALLNALNIGLPSGGMVLAARTVITTVLLGTVVTVLAASAPARRAGRIAPVAAMREEFASPSASSLRRRTALGAIIGVAGVAATVAGLTAKHAGPAAGFTGLGLVGVVAAAMLLSPLLAQWVIVPMGRVIGRPFGPIGRLARTNAVRNPRRTAATAFALTLGLVLVTGIAVIGASFKASIDKLFENNVRADYILTTDSEVNVPPAAAQAAANVPGVASVTQFQTLRAMVNGKGRAGSSVDGPIDPVMKVTMDAGTLNVSGHHMIVSKTTLDNDHWTVGSQHTLVVPGLKPITLTVAGVFADDELIGPWLVNGNVYRALTPKDRWSDDVALVHARPGANLESVRAGLAKATNDFYVVDVRNRSEFQGYIAAQINGLLGLLYGLLGLAIVIAILGIVNTQALSVIERRREIGMLRAVAMQRKQVRRTIYLESLLIAVFGAALGVALGMTFGGLFARTLSSQGLDTISLPWGQAVLFLALAAVIGVLAALWPGFRAARTPPLAAVAEA